MVRANRLSKRAGWLALAGASAILVGIVSAAMFAGGDGKSEHAAGQAVADGQALQQAAQQAALQQTAWAEKLKMPVHQKNSLGMGLTLIPPGEFLMGSSALEVQQAVAIERREVPEGWPMWYFTRKVEVEAPAHKVKLTRPFLLGTHEVTVADWDAFEKDTHYRRIARREPDRFGQEGFGPDQAKWDAALPMAYVSWDDARAFCSWLSTKENKLYRLPTEAEWEYACRGGTTTCWFTGNDVESLRDYAWTLQTCGAVRPADRNDASVRPEKVGTKKPNPFGLHDMTGNVWEWCRDYFLQDYYVQSPAEDPTGPQQLSEKQFPGTVVLRGGANGFRENESRAATRWFLKPHAPERYIGFRVVCELSDKPAE
jgi:formylglycine-generating enzyme required for sulfatase activity